VPLEKIKVDEGENSAIQRYHTRAQSRSHGGTTAIKTSGDFTGAVTAGGGPTTGTKGGKSNKSGVSLRQLAKRVGVDQFIM
jgi:hypothetical protein